jgi:splicing factor 3A subunit 1
MVSTEFCNRQEAGAIGPGIGPAAAPPPMAVLPPPPASLPPPPTQATGGAASVNPAYSAATVSSGPQPSSMYPSQAAPVMLPPLHYQGLDAAQPFGYQPPPPVVVPPVLGMHPARMAALSAAGTNMVPEIGMVRSADEMEGVDNIPPAKRQKVARLPGGQLYPEMDWINMHPVKTYFSLGSFH